LTPACRVGGCTLAVIRPAGLSRSAARNSPAGRPGTTPPGVAEAACQGAPARDPADRRFRLRAGICSRLCRVVRALPGP